MRGNLYGICSVEEVKGETIKLTSGSLSTQAGVPERYQIKSVIGQGGMGMVLHALDTELDREVAIKLLLFEGARDEESQGRFLREGKALSILNHPNIVRIFSSALNDKGDPYHVMEFIRGDSLSKILAEARLTPSVFFNMTMQVFYGLEHAHANGIVHRDLKPSNIMHCKELDGSDLYKIIDFGIAKLQNTDQHSKTLTKTDVVLGSPLYMSPEQCRGERGGVASDIYSMGCIMYEGLTGKPPLEGDSAFETMYMHMKTDPPSLAGMAVSPASKKLGALVDSCLQKDPEQRPQSAKEVRDRLEEIQNFDHTSMDLFSASKSALAKQGKSKNNIVLITALPLVLIVVAGVVYKMANAPKGPVIELRSDEARIERELEKARARITRWKNPDSLKDVSARESYLLDLYALGRQELASSKPSDRAKARDTYERALIYCQSKKMTEYLPGCTALFAKAELAQGDLEGSEANFSAAIGLAKELKQNEVLIDIYYARVRLDIAKHDFKRAMRDVHESFKIYEAFDSRATALDLTRWDQKLDKFGPNRMYMAKEVAEQLLVQRKFGLENANDSERIDMIELSNLFIDKLARMKYLGDGTRVKLAKLSRDIFNRIEVKAKIPPSVMSKYREHLEKYGNKG